MGFMRYRTAVNIMLRDQKIPFKGGVFIDAYNHSVRELATVTCDVGCNNYYVTEWTP